MGRELKAKDIKIDDRLYKIVPMRYRDAAKFAKRIGEVIGASMIDLEAGDIQKALQSFFEKIDIDELCDLIEICLLESLCDGKKIDDFDELFSGNLEHLIKVAVEVTKVNIGNFSLESILPTIKETTQKIQN